MGKQKKFLLMLTVIGLLSVVNAAALNWPPLVEQDCAPRWSPVGGEQEVVWADQMRECAFCLANQPDCKFGPNPPSAPGTDVPEFGSLAVGLALSGAGLAYLALRR